MATKKAFATDITGQDASYLVELLPGKGYEVPGLGRQARTSSGGRPATVCSNPQWSVTRLILHCGDLGEEAALAGAKSALPS